MVVVVKGPISTIKVRCLCHKDKGSDKDKDRDKDKALPSMYQGVLVCRDNKCKDKGFTVTAAAAVRGVSSSPRLHLPNNNINNHNNNSKHGTNNNNSSYLLNHHCISIRMTCMTNITP